MKIERVAIIGLGALGVMFGNQISKTAPKGDLRIIADAERVERYKKEGIYSNGQLCTLNYVLPETNTGPADMVIFAVKNHDLSDAIRAVKHQVGPETLMLSLLNGITSEARIGEAYRFINVLYCVAQEMDAVKVGNRLTYQNMGKLCFGDLRDEKPSSKVLAVARFFDKTSVPYEIDPDMQRKLWSKLMVNVGVNQTVAVYGKCYGDVQRSGHVRGVMIAAMQEVLALSEKEGICLTEEDLQYWLDVIGRLDPNGKPSMRQDIEACRKSEVELFAGTILELGRKHGIATPVNESLFAQITDMENQYLR